MLAAAVDLEGRQITTLEWLPIDRWTPVKSDPNNGRAPRWFWVEKYPHSAWLTCMADQVIELIYVGGN